LLARLQPRAPAPETQSASLLEPAQSTMVGTSANEATPAMVSAPTILVSPTAARAPALRTRYQGLFGKDGPLRRRYEQLWKPDRTSRKHHEPLWRRYRWAALAAALLVLVAGIVLVVILLSRSLRPSVQLLTITRPV